MHHAERYLFSLIHLSLWFLAPGFVLLPACSDVVVTQTPAALEASPNELRFPPTRVGEIQVMTLTLLETSTRREVVVRSAEVEGEKSEVFELDASVPVTIARGGEVTWTVTFRPTQLGSVSAEVLLLANGDIEVPEITLLGEGRGPDTDGDGVSEDEGDCDDSDAGTSPDAPEQCDGQDNDCDGTIDEDAEDAIDWFADEDGDGYGGGVVVTACEGTEGTLPVGGDCLDSDASIHPNADEDCDDIDRNCDGDPTAGAIDATVWYLDGDQDGFGGGSITYGCTAPDGTVTTHDDCNDGDPTVHPGAEETCDGRDEDCDDAIDEEVLEPPAWYADLDNDGYGDAGDVIYDCEASGRVPLAGDCDDAAPLIHPDAQEACDDIDQDCDGQIDDGLVFEDYYPDSDGDSYGASGNGQSRCEPLPGHVTNGSDCNDVNPWIHPGVTELCDGIDQDCDGQIDDGLVYVVYYPDSDGDGYGDDDEGQSRCEPLEGRVAVGSDCNDGDSSIHPGVSEICDGIDQDCDGQIDDGLPLTTWYMDGDGDGYGDPADDVTACAAPVAYIRTDGDCNDALASVHPGADEHCNGIDDDCNGAVDEGPVDGSRWYADVDGDGYGAGTASIACTAPGGLVAMDGDCVDTNAAINPVADEVCNEIDDDCNGEIDDDAIDAITWMEDTDGDGYGDAPEVEACEAPPGYVPEDDDHPIDCDDDDPTTYPGAPESCDGLDYDCDGIWSPASCDGCHVVQGDSSSLYPTIQQALDAAVVGIDFGGEIRICPGTYYENLKFNGAPVILRGDDSATTILDGSLCTRGNDRCSTVAFIGSEGAASGLKNFTVRGGKGSVRNTFQSGGSTATAGGGILMSNASPVLEDLLITGNQAADGGGVFALGGAPTLERLKVKGHQNGQRGGGMYLESTSARLEAIELLDNRVSGQGGGLFLSYGTGVNLEGLRIDGNQSSGNGGGMYLYRSDTHIVDLEVEDNVSASTSGGGMYCDLGSLTLEVARFDNNSVAGGSESQGGGGLFLSNLDDAVLDQLEVTGNRSNGNGGGLSIVNSEGVLLEDSLVDANTAVTFGGGLSMYDSSRGSVRLERTTFTSNHARWGGGVWGGRMNLASLQSLFMENTCDEFGAGIYLSITDVEIYNNLFLANTANRQGGALYLDNASGEVVNNTLAVNYAGERASGIQVVTGTPTLLNNILGYGEGSSVVINGPSTLSTAFEFNDVYPGSVSGFTMNSTNIALDPQFVTNLATTTSDPVTWVLTLKPVSPCINRGDDAPEYEDVDGSRNDMGTYGGPEGAW